MYSTYLQALDACGCLCQIRALLHAFLSGQSSSRRPPFQHPTPRLLYVPFCQPNAGDPLPATYPQPQLVIYTLSVINIRHPTSERIDVCPTDDEQGWHCRVVRWGNSCLQESAAHPTLGILLPSDLPALFGLSQWPLSPGQCRTHC